MTEGKYELLDIQLAGGFGRCHRLRAEVTLRCPDGQEVKRVSTDGVGMIDCAIRAVNFIVGPQAPKLASFNAWMKKTESKMGSAAPGNCGLTVYSNGDSRGKRALGQSSHSDIVVASVLAYIDGINNLLSKKQG